MTITTPDWLQKRGGQIRPHYDGRCWVVVFEGQPQYVLRPIPAAGKHGCEVEQMINQRRVETSAIYGSAAEAINGGLNDLRKVLGW